MIIQWWRITFALVLAITLGNVGSCLAEEKSSPPFGRHPGGVTCLAIAPDGKTLATGGLDRNVRLWDLAAGSERAVLPGHTDVVRCVCFAPDGRQLASGGQDRTVRIWNVATGEPVRVLKQHAGAVNQLAYFPDGTSVASASDDETTRIFDVVSGRELRRIYGARQRYAGLAISADGGKVYTIGASRFGDRWTRQWDATVARETARLGPAPAQPLAIALSPGGELLAVSLVPTAKADKSITLWDVATGKESAVQIDVKNLVSHLTFFPNGKGLVSAGPDGAITFWDVPSGKEWASLRPSREDALLTALALNPDGRQIVYALNTGEIFLAEVPQRPSDQPILAEKIPKDAGADGGSQRGIVSSESRPGHLDPGKDRAGKIKLGEPPRARRLIQAGESFFVEWLVSRQSTYRMQGLDLTASAQYRMLTFVSVEKRTPEGRWLVRQRIEDAQLESADEVTRGLLADAIAQLKGTTHRFTLNEKLEVTDLEGVVDPLQARGGLNLLGRQGAAAVSVLDKDGWKELLQLVFLSADQPLSAGARWEQPVRHAWGPLGLWTGKALYHHEGRQGDAHRIRYRLDIRHEPPKGASGDLPFSLGKAAFRLQEGSGALQFDAARQRVTLAEEVFRVRGDLSLTVLGQAAAVDVEEEQRFRLRITDGDPRRR